eukprot:scaffold32626_cov72-Skeletonema_dohrnii-CCMP3373.AAC.1
MAADGWHIYYGRDGEVIPPGVTRVRIHESVTAIPARAFDGNIDIEEVECHVDVKTVEERAFAGCPSLRRVRMPGVEVVFHCAFAECEALADVECGKLERIGFDAFCCTSLGSIDLPSAKIVEEDAFSGCTALTNINFGKKLESIGGLARCTSLERITIPLKDGIITNDSIFQGCEKLTHVDLVEGAVLSDTIDTLLLEDWRNDMNREMLSINQILSYTPAGNRRDVGGKAQAVRMWIRSVLRTIV